MGIAVDERVVEMRFDNHQFERGVQSTMGALDKLKQSLKLDGASKGLDNVNQAAKNVSLDACDFKPYGFDDAVWKEYGWVCDGQHYRRRKAQGDEY